MLRRNLKERRLGNVASRGNDEEGLRTELTFTSKPSSGGELNHVGIWGKSTLDRVKTKYKGPETNVVWQARKQLKNEVREETDGQMA